MSCNRCGTSQCSCGIPAVPQPYNAGGCSVQENHVQQIFQAQYSFGVTITSAWNVPLCGGSAILKVPGIINFPVGEFLHHESYGYFKVIAFSAEDEEITVQNTCLSDNASVGTQVSACTTFSVGPAPCCEDTSQSGVYVKIGFTAPEEDDCLDIEVTSEEGLISGNLATIGTGIYRIQAVKSDNIITICNEGEGILPGSPVIAVNPFTNEYQYPIISISVNACSQNTVASGIPLVCVNGSGYPLLGTEPNSVLTVINGTTGEATFSLALPAAVANLNNQVPGALASIASIQTELTALDNRIFAIQGKGAKSLSDPKENVDLTSANTEILTNLAEITISNTSTIRGMYVMYTVVTRLFGNVKNGLTDRLVYTLDIGQRVTFDGGIPPGVTSLTNMNEIAPVMVNNTAADNPYDVQRTWTDLILLNPSVNANNSVNLQFQGVLTWFDGVGGNTVEYHIDNFDIQVTAIGVPI